MQKVMRAMNMISSIKLRKLYAVQNSLALFETSLNSMLKMIISSVSGSDSPATRGYENEKNIHIVMFTADKGLCGTHNSSVQKAVNLLIMENLEKGRPAEITCIGSKGAAFCARRDYKVFRKTEISDRVLTTEKLREISSGIFTRFMENRVQRVYAVGNIFHSTLNHETVTAQLLPLPEPGTAENTAVITEFLTEPAEDLFAEAAAGLYVFYKLKSMLLNSSLSEQSARMTAMENATNNSEDLINTYKIALNRARQASITNELIEIVSGKEALKG